MKKCSICHELKDPSFYNKNKCKKDGLNTICKPCSRLRSRKYYLDNHDDHLIQIKKRNKSQRNIRRDFLLNYLSDKECLDCGNSDSRVLEFDHLRDKKFNISRLVCSYSINLIEQEILKCEVVCCNCHRIRTLTRCKSYRIGVVV